MKALLAIPLNALILMFYNGLILISTPENYLPDTVVAVFTIPSDAELTLTWNIIVVLAAIFVLFIEIVKATRSTDKALLDHILSMGVFVVFLIEFLIWREMGSATFLILTLLAFVDVIAGFTVSLSTARRDISFEG